MPTFEDITGSLDRIMGVKAVWGRSSEAVMCFGSRGDPAARDRAHFTQARVTAEKAINQPFLVTIGGGEHVTPDLDGRVIELVRVTGAYGETGAFVRDPDLRARLMQWPVAVVLSEVYALEGEPHLIDDLGFPDRRILANAYDGVRRDDEQMARLWEALRAWPVVRKADVRPPPGFRDPGRVSLWSTMYPTLSARSSEGKRVWKESRALERDRKLVRAVKDANRARNGGMIVCEACDLASEDSRLFDAHHLEPLATGVRESHPEDFAVLCPTCHRWAHYLAPDVLQPLTVAAVREKRRAIT